MDRFLPVRCEQILRLGVVRSEEDSAHLRKVAHLVENSCLGVSSDGGEGTPEYIEHKKEECPGWMKVEEEDKEIDHAQADDDGSSDDVGECHRPLGARGNGFRGAVCFA